MAKHQPVYKSKIYCKCKVCKSWDRERTGSWECRKIECLCEERVILLVKQVKAGSNELSVTYECAEERCGFKIAAHDANCHAYVTILADMKEYMFYHTLDKCECGKDVHLVLERITAGTNHCGNGCWRSNERTIDQFEQRTTVVVRMLDWSMLVS
jgi:hypothetical protein